MDPSPTSKVLGAGPQRAKREFNEGEQSCRPGFEPRTPTIRSGTSDRPTILSGAALGAELNERPACRNQVLFEAAVEGRQFVEIGEREDPLIARVRFDVQGQPDTPLDADRRGVAHKQPGRRTHFVVRARRWNFRKTFELGRIRTRRSQTSRDYNTRSPRTTISADDSLREQSWYSPCCLALRLSRRTNG